MVVTSSPRESKLISYAQNQEDVVLCRLLNLVERGTYIDVGAGHPIIENVTYALYMRGWRGVNIEPMPREAEMLRELRPEDHTFQIAAGAEHGHVMLHVAPLENRGASTLSQELASSYVARGQKFTSEQVEMRTVMSVAREVELDTVHILKIDVETYESEVLDGSNLADLRPWVIVIEATRPNSSVDSSIEWSDKILGAGYVLAQFDGLNNFYVRDDLPDIVALMSVPANVFDGWVSWELIATRRELDNSTESSRRYTNSLEEAIDEARQERDEAKEYVDKLEKLLFKSTGWIPARSRNL